VSSKGTQLKAGSPRVIVENCRVRPIPPVALLTDGELWKFWFPASVLSCYAEAYCLQVGQGCGGQLRHAGVRQAIQAMRPALRGLDASRHYMVTPQYDLLVRCQPASWWRTVERNSSCTPPTAGRPAPLRSNGAHGGKRIWMTEDASACCPPSLNRHWTRFSP